MMRCCDKTDLRRPLELRFIWRQKYFDGKMGGFFTLCVGIWFADLTVLSAGLFRNVLTARVSLRLLKDNSERAGFLCCFSAVEVRL